MKKLILVVCLFMVSNVWAATWQDVGDRCERTYVARGWLVRCHVFRGMGVTFVPDRNHEWLG